MMKRFVFKPAFGFLLPFLFCLPIVVQAQTQYRVVDIGASNPNSVSSRGLGINSLGSVVLTYDIPHQAGLPAVWQYGVVTTLPLDGNRYATGIDRWGNVVGTFSGLSWGWIYSGGAYFGVPDPSWLSPDYFYATSRALAINDDGVFTGTISQLAPPGSYPAYTAATEAYSAIQLPKGQILLQRLGRFNGLSTSGWGINDLSHVVGFAGPATQSTPVLFRDGQIEELPKIGGPLNRGEGINNVGFAVGFVSSVNQTGGFYAGSGAVWDVRVPGSPQLTLIGQLQGSNQSWLYDINDAGVAIGNAALFQASVNLWAKPIRWTAAEGVQDLNNLLDSTSAGWQITEVRAINASGQIVGTARLNGSLPRAVRLDPQQDPKARTKKYLSR
jgi:uncharacterized membrane protein